MVEAPVRPVLLDRQRGNRACPVREMQVPGRLVRRRRYAVVGERALPGLQRPVGAVGCLAGRDEPAERRAVVAAAVGTEGLPVVAVILAVAARVVEGELDLLVCA